MNEYRVARFLWPTAYKYCSVV